MTVALTSFAPGFRRRFRVTPAPGLVRSEVEDDYHCMSVSLHHDAGIATAVQAELLRAPWSTCPGAAAVCESTFGGRPLADFPVFGEKTSNCTHLYDLALLAAAHALDDYPLVYDICVSDPVGGVREAQIFRDGERVLGWTDRDFEIVEPAELAGMDFATMRRWIESLDAAGQEAARLLRWGAVIARGRTIPLERQSDASRMPPNCYTFQPERAAIARRIGAISDFSNASVQPLELEGKVPSNC